MNYRMTFPPNLLAKSQNYRLPSMFTSKFFPSLLRSQPFSFSLLIALLLGYLYFPVVLLAQEQPPRRVRNPALINYGERIEQAKKERQWSQVYFASYLKTKELAYLRLSASHSIQSIQYFYQTEARLAKSTKFYYQTKLYRMGVCEYYRKLQIKSFQLKLENHLPDVEPETLCAR